MAQATLIRSGLIRPERSPPAPAVKGIVYGALTSLFVWGAIAIAIWAA